jgi:hypothetical protein
MKAIEPGGSDRLKLRDRADGQADGFRRLVKVFA